jgi:hypothetical protein
MTFWIVMAVLASLTTFAAMLCILSINRRLERMIRRSQQPPAWAEKGGEFIDRHDVDVRNKVRRKIRKSL